MEDALAFDCHQQFAGKRSAHLDRCRLPGLVLALVQTQFEPSRVFDCPGRIPPAADEELDLGRGPGLRVAEDHAVTAELGRGERELAARRPTSNRLAI